MTAVGGSVESVSLDGRNFTVAADAEGNRKLGGYENETPANGDGSARLTKTRMNWQMNGLSLVMDDSQGDAEFIQNLMDQKGFFSQTFILASGLIYMGTGQITGEAPTSTQSQTAPMNFGGGGKLVPQ